MIAKLKVKLHEERMNERLNEGFTGEKDVFAKVIEKSKKNNKRSYDFLIKASHEYQDALYGLCKRIIEDETVPNNFRETTLHQIWNMEYGIGKWRGS